MTKNNPYQEPVKIKAYDLLDSYYSGDLDASEVAEKLFTSNDADRGRKNIQKRYDKINSRKDKENRQLQEV